MRTPLTTLCYLEKDDCYLMMHRVKKENDCNKDKYVGVGGHFEENESPVDCLLREVKEETGLTLTQYRARGIVTFISDIWGIEYMFLYTATGFEGDLSEGSLAQCNEGNLEWIPKSEVCSLPVWEGDKIFFRLLANEHPYFDLKLTYVGDELTQAVLDGKEMEI